MGGEHDIPWGKIVLQFCLVEFGLVWFNLVQFKKSLVVRGWGLKMENRVLVLKIKILVWSVVAECCSENTQKIW